MAIFTAVDNVDDFIGYASEFAGARLSCDGQPVKIVLTRDDDGQYHFKLSPLFEFNRERKIRK